MCAGDVEAARSTYKLLLEKLAPDLVEAIVQAANFERRQSNMEAACKAFDDALEREEQKEGQSLGFNRAKKPDKGFCALF